MSNELSPIEQQYMDSYVASPGIQQLEGIMFDLDRAQARADARTAIIKAVLDETPYAMIVSTMTGEFALWNRLAEKLVGRGPILSMPERWAHDYQCRLPATPLKICEPEELPLWKALHGQTIHNYEMLVGSMDKPVHIVCDAQPIMDPHGQQVGAMVTFVDKNDPNRCRDAICSRR
jgi:PAS domain-containing protein